MNDLTCERCGHRAYGVWIGFQFIGFECLTKEDKEYLDNECGIKSVSVEDYDKIREALAPAKA
jgi:hypothetical protein